MPELFDKHRINIREIGLEAETKKSRIFDPLTDISESQWRKMYEALENSGALSEPNDTKEYDLDKLIDGIGIASFLKILKGEQFRLNKNLCLSKKLIDRYYLSADTVLSLAVLFPDELIRRHPTLYDFYKQRFESESEGASSDLYCLHDTINSALILKLMAQDTFYEDRCQPFIAQHWDALLGDGSIMYRISEPSLGITFSTIQTQARAALLFPERKTSLSIDNSGWQELIEFLHRVDTAERRSFVDLALILYTLSDHTEVQMHGSQIIIHPRSKVALSTDSHSIPTAKRY